MNELMFIHYVNRLCEAKGPAHIVKEDGGDGTPKPVVLCGIDTSDLNWTRIPKGALRVDICNNCLRIFNKSK